MLNFLLEDYALNGFVALMIGAKLLKMVIILLLFLFLPLLINQIVILGVIFYRNRKIKCNKTLTNVNSHEHAKRTPIGKNRNSFKEIKR